MEAPSPARLYAAAAGVLLLSLGVAGFFYGADLGAPGTVEAALGVLRVNGWLNLLQIATGALGLLAAGVASRRYALLAGGFYTALAIWGFALDSGAAILGFLPASGGDDTFHLIIGLLGLAAAAATPRTASRGSLVRNGRTKEPRDRSEARAEAAGEGA
jgi:Domain of unknown function (DUF4383)